MRFSEDFRPFTLLAEFNCHIHFNCVHPIGEVLSVENAAKAIKTVLKMLAEPAFLAQDGHILWANPAAQALSLKEGDALPALLPPDAKLPEGEDALRCTAEFLGAEWDLSVQAMERQQLYILRKQQLPDSGNLLLLSASSSIRPAVEEILAAGARLFPQLEELENEEMQASASKISHGCFRLMRTLTELGAYDRLCREDAPLHREKCDLTEFFAAFAEKTADVLLDAGIRLQYSLPNSCVFGTVDKLEVQRAVLHLIANAAAHTPEGGELWLRVSLLGKKLRIAVENAASVQEDVLPTAFSRYLFPGEGDVKQGAGLGLSVVQKVAQHHGGTVLMESKDSLTSVSMTIDLSCPVTELKAPRQDYCGGYDPVLVELSPLLPAKTFDSRSVDL